MSYTIIYFICCFIAVFFGIGVYCSIRFIKRNKRLKKHGYRQRLIWFDNEYIPAINTTVYKEKDFKNISLIGDICLDVLIKEEATGNN